MSFRTKVGNVIPFDRARPNADCIMYDDDNCPMYLYTIRYHREDGTYESDIWAYSQEDAERRLAEIRKSGTISGQVFGRIWA